MSVSIDQYRAKIGLFRGGGSTTNYDLFHRGLSARFKIFWALYALTVAMQLQVDPWIAYLLTISMDIEKNPGPILGRDIKICNVNIRSLNAKPRHPGGLLRFTAFKNALAGTYDIITATESWLKTEHPDNDYVIPGFSGPFRRDRPHGRGHGGVIAWVSHNLVSKRRQDLEQPDHEGLWIQVGNKEKQVLIGVSYRQKKGDYADDYWEKLQLGYDKAVETRIPNIVLMGDFNADPGTEKGAHDTLSEFIAINNLTQHINEPTRYTDENESKLDLIMSNLPMLIKEAGVGTPVHENDHCSIYGTLDMKTIDRQTFFREMWDFKNANFNNFREELSNTNWDTCFASDNIDEICDKWSELFLKISEKHVKRKKVRIRPTDKNWYNNYLRNLRRVKDRDYRSWTRDKNDLNWAIYRASRNNYFQECERIKMEYEEHIYANLASEIDKNPKRWWSLVGKVMNTTKKSSYPILIKNGEMYETDREKANIFNETYLESSTLEANEYELPLEEPNLPDHDLIDNVIVQEQDVEDILKGLDVNKAYGPDNLSPRLLKEAGGSIVKVLTLLFNKSLELAKFPQAWKRANVLPIFKKAETFITTNYRPVSLLSILAKVFEKIVFKYLYNYFCQHFLISVWQSGFLPGSSTVTQLTEIYNEFCKAVNKGKEIRVVFLDISKAFDRVWHKGLLHKLKGLWNNRQITRMAKRLFNR